MAPQAATGTAPPDHLALSVAAAYRLGSGARIDGPPARGHVGRVWPLSTTAFRYAVKVPFAAPDPEAVRADAAYQDALRAAGVDLPAVVRTPEGEVLAEVVDGAVVRVYEWVDVAPPDRGLDPAAVGRTVAAVHAVEDPGDRVLGHGPRVDPWHTDPVGATAWLDLADRASAAGAPFAPALHRLVPELVALEGLLEPPGPVRRCHRDLWADNVRAAPGGRVVVLDWESSGPADPVGELPMVMFEFGQGDPARMRELYAAYVASGGPARVTRAGDCSMLVASLGHILEEGVRRWLVAENDEDRAHNAAWVSEGVDDPLSRQVVEQIVSAARSVTAGR